MLFDTRYFSAIFSSKDEETTSKLKSLFNRSKSAYVSSIIICEVFKLTLASEDKTAAISSSRQLKGKMLTWDNGVT
jgi:predicted nucleic acid-binding protein